VSSASFTMDATTVESNTVELNTAELNAKAVRARRASRPKVKTGCNNCK
jgi:hypothetical protein